MFNEMDKQNNSSPAIKALSLGSIVLAILIVVGLAVWGGLNYYNKYQAEKSAQKLPGVKMISTEEKKAILDALNKGSTTPDITIKEKQAILDALNKKTVTTKTGQRAPKPVEISASEKQAILDALNKK